MKDKIFGVLQRVGRSFMLPIAVLPVAGLLLGIGSSFTNETTIATYGLQGIFGNGTVLHALLMIMSKAGNVIFDNLPIIFAVGVAIGMAKAEKEVAALSAMISFFVMHASINAVLLLAGKVLNKIHVLFRKPRVKLLAFISPIYANYANSSITSSANSDNVYKNLVLPSDL